MTDASPRTRPEALFEKAKLDDSPTVAVTPEPGSRRAQLAKKVALKVLQRLQRDALVLTEGADVTILGPGDGLEATITVHDCLLYTSPSPRDRTRSRMPSSA